MENIENHLVRVEDEDDMKKENETEKAYGYDYCLRHTAWRFFISFFISGILPVPLLISRDVWDAYALHNVIHLLYYVLTLFGNDALGSFRVRPVSDMVKAMTMGCILVLVGGSPLLIFMIGRLDETNVFLSFYTIVLYMVFCLSLEVCSLPRYKLYIFRYGLGAAHFCGLYCYSMLPSNVATIALGCLFIVSVILLYVQIQLHKILLSPCPYHRHSPVGYCLFEEVAVMKKKCFQLNDIVH